MYWTPFMSYSLLVQNIVSTFVEENFGLMEGGVMLCLQNPLVKNTSCTSGPVLWPQGG